MKTSRKNPAPGTEFEKQTADVLERMFKILAVVLMPGIAVTAMRIRDSGLLLSYPVQWACAVGMVAVIALQGRISYSARVALFGASLFVYGASGLIGYGLFGHGLLLLLAVCVFATVAGGVKYGCIVAGGSSLVTVLAGIGFQKGWLSTVPNPAEYAVSLWPWVNAVMTILVLSIVVAFFLGKAKTLWFENIRRTEISEARHRLLAENITDEIWTFDLHTMRFTYVSPSVRRIRGYSPEEALALTLEETVSQDSLEHLTRVLQQELERDGEEGVDPERSRTIEIRIAKKEGGWSWIEATMNFIRDDQGWPKEILGVSRDITERKRIEEERRRLEAQLQHTQKMESIGTLAGGIAHDFNNILGGIIGYTELALCKTANGDGKLNGYLHQVLGAGNRARDLVRQILKFSRRDEAAMGPFSVQPILKECLRLLHSTLPSFIEVRECVKADLDRIVGDPTQIHQVIMNLCTNAYHAMQDGGVLTVSLTNETVHAPRAFMSLEMSPGEYVKLSVEDTGEGIPAEIQDRIFEPYFTTKKMAQGTGLGLAVVLGIVKAHNGLMEVESRAGEGSRFDVYFPVTEEENAEPEDPKAAPPKGRGEEILVVDDERFFLEVLKEHLEALGYRVTADDISRRALERFDREPDRFGLVITDQTMPELTGIQLISEIRKRRTDIPVVLCTGYSDTVTEQTIRSDGFTTFLMKPISRHDLAWTAHDALNPLR